MQLEPTAPACSHHFKSLYETLSKTKKDFNIPPLNSITSNRFTRHYRLAWPHHFKSLYETLSNKKDFQIPPLNSITTNRFTKHYLFISKHNSRTPACSHHLTVSKNFKIPTHKCITTNRFTKHYLLNFKPMTMTITMTLDKNIRLQNQTS